MVRRESSWLLGVAITASLFFGMAVGGARSAQAADPILMSAPADEPAQSEPAGDDRAQSLPTDPTRDRAVTCTCAPAGSGCSGACPNAPGKKRYCKNMAPAGKPKICSCV